MNPTIIYYSRTGNTEEIAKKLEADFNCTAFKLEPTEEYMQYCYLEFRKMNEDGKVVEPAFETEVPDVSAYDTIFVGYPVWAQDLPEFVAEFLKKCNISGKTIIPFATYALTETNFAKQTIEKSCPDCEIKFPFQAGMFKKPDYDAWVAEIKAAE